MTRPRPSLPTPAAVRRGGANARWLPPAAGLLAAVLFAGLPARGQGPVDFLDADRARDSYHAFLELAPADDPRRADALRRLADLELERAEELLLEEADEAAAAAAYGEAIRLYEALLGEYPGQAQGDVILYQLARAHDQRGDRPAAVAVLGRLVQSYPASPLVGEAWFRQGEAWFLSGDFDLAADAYAQVIALADDATFREQSLYKRGWALFRDGLYEAGLHAFWTLTEEMLTTFAADTVGEGAAGRVYRPRAEEALGRAEQELLDDTLRAMAMSFSYLRGVESLTAFLQQQPRYGFEHLFYAGLGDLYLSQERYAEAASTYDAFPVAYPEHRQAPALQLRVIDTYAEAGFTGQVLEAKEAFALRYALTEPFWSLHDPADMADVVAALKQHLTDLTEYHHARAQSLSDEEGADAAAIAEAYATATQWYRRWLASFPAAPQTPGKRFLLAELLFERGFFDAATEEYERTAYDYGEHERAGEAGYAALLAYDRHALALADQPEARRAWRRRGVDSALRFSATFPEHPQAAAVQTRAAEDLFAYTEFEAAVAAAATVTAWAPAPAPELLTTAWTVIGHAQFERARYGEAEEAYAQLLATAALTSQERADLVERLAASVYRQAEAHRDAGDLASAVVDFQRVGIVAPDASIVATADYDAAAALIQMERWDSAADALTAFRARHPGHAFTGDVTRKLATAYLALDDAASAAPELERIAQAEAQSMDVRIDAAWNAADQYERAGDSAGTLRLLAYLSDALPVSLDERVDAGERIAALHEEAGNLAARDTALQRLVAMDRDAGANRTARSRSAAASAALTLADVARGRFEAIDLTLPIAESLAAKREAMNRTLDAYQLAADYGVAGVTTAAAFHVADLYLQLGRALMDSERPGELDELELEQYEFLLEEQAFPFEEQGIALHEANARRTADGVYDEWVQGSLRRLAALVPARYAKAEQGETYVSYLE